MYLPVSPSPYASRDRNHVSYHCIPSTLYVLNNSSFLPHHRTSHENLKPVVASKPWLRMIILTAVIQHNSTKLSDQFRILAYKLLFLLAQTFTFKVCLLLKRLQEIGLVLSPRKPNRSCFLQGKGLKEACRYLMNIDEPLRSHEY